jgi:hypothetical protein
LGRKRPGQRNLAAGLTDGVEEFFGMADTGKGQKSLAGQPHPAGWPRMRLEDRSAGTRRLANDGICSKAVAHLQQRAGENQLVDDASPERTARNDAAVADAVACVDNDQRIVDVDARALETVIHDQEITAMLFQQEAGAGGTVRRHCDRRVRGQKQRFIADMLGGVMMRIDDMRPCKGAAMAARQETWIELHAPGLPGQFDRHRRLAGAADCEVADAKHRRLNLLARR